MRFVKKHLSVVGIVFMMSAIISPALLPAAKTYAAERSDISMRGSMTDRATVNINNVNVVLLDSNGRVRTDSFRNIPDEMVSGGQLTNESFRQIVNEFALGEWKDSNIGNQDYDYEITKDDCTSKMELRYADGEQKFRLHELQLDFDDGEGCTNVLVGNLELTGLISMQPGFDTWFRWINSTQMQRVDGWGGDWIQSSRFPDRYTSSSDPTKVVTNVRDNFTWADYTDKVGGDMNGNNSDFVRIGNVDARSNVGPPPGTTEQQEEDNTCESQSGAMGWIMCPLINLLDGALNFVDSQVQRLLEVDEDKYTHDSLKAAWTQIRNIAYVILIPIMLVMVIGTALGFEVFSAYTVRKALPRMALAVIFIALSWYICAFLIEFFNVLGQGALGLVTAPFKSSVPASCQDSITLSCLFDVPFSGESSAAGGVLHSILILPQYAGIFIGTIAILYFFGSALILLIGTAFFILLARQMFIIALILLAPLAIIAWIFPGNDKLWKSWWSIFTKLLFMYPLIMMLIGVGRVFAIILNEVGGSGADGAVLNPILKLLAYMLPYAMIPFTFKFAGGVLGNLAGMINDREKGLFDRARKKRAERAERAVRKPKAYVQGKRYDSARRLQGWSSGAGLGGRYLGRRAAGLVGGSDYELRNSERNAEAAKIIDAEKGAGNDLQVRGATTQLKRVAALQKKQRAGTATGEELATLSSLYQEKDGKRQYRSLGGAWIDEADAIEGHRRFGRDRSLQQAALTYELGKAKTSEQVRGVMQDYNSLATEQWGMSKLEKGAAWSGATFNTQGQHVELKSLNTETGQLDHEKFVNEVHENKGSYPLAQMNAHTIESLSAAYDAGDDGTKQKVREIVETFSYRGGVVADGDETRPAAPGAGGHTAQGSAEVNRQLGLLVEKISPPSARTPRPPAPDHREPGGYL